MNFCDHCNGLFKIQMLALVSRKGKVIHRFKRNFPTKTDGQTIICINCYPKVRYGELK